MSQLLVSWWNFPPESIAGVNARVSNIQMLSFDSSYITRRFPVLPWLFLIIHNSDDQQQPWLPAKFFWPYLQVTLLTVSLPRVLPQFTPLTMPSLPSLPSFKLIFARSLHLATNSDRNPIGVRWVWSDSDQILIGLRFGWCASHFHFSVRSESNRSLSSVRVIYLESEQSNVVGLLGIR